MSGCGVVIIYGVHHTGIHPSFGDAPQIVRNSIVQKSQTMGRLKPETYVTTPIGHTHATTIRCCDEETVGGVGRCRRTLCCIAAMERTLGWDDSPPALNNRPLAIANGDRRGRERESPPAGKGEKGNRLPPMSACLYAIQMDTRHQTSDRQGGGPPVFVERRSCSRNRDCVNRGEHDSY